MLAEVIARLIAEVPALAGRVQGAADFAELVKRNALPQHTPAAHVLPLGWRGDGGEAAAGFFTQMVEETVAVIVTFRAPGGSAPGDLPDIDALLRAVIGGIAGWGPEEAVGVFRLLRGGLVHAGPGVLVYQIDFAIADQLRIEP